MNPEQSTDLAGMMHEFVDAALQRSMAGHFQFCKHHNISFSQLSILHRLYRMGPATVSEISRMLDISKSAVSQLLDKLVQGGLISRCENPVDRRSKNHSITAEGKVMIEKSREARVEWVESLNEKITSDERELLTRALSVLQNRIGELEPVHHHHKGHAQKEA